MYPIVRNSKDNTQRPSALRTLPLLFSTLLLFAAVASSFLVLYGPLSRDIVGALAPATLVLSYLVREAIYFLYSPPKYWFLGARTARYGLRLAAFFVRCAVRVGQASLYAAFCVLAFSFGSSLTPGALMAGFITAFIAVSVLQDSEWGTLRVPRGTRVHPPGLYASTGGGRSGGYIIYVREVHREFHYTRERS